MVSPETNWRIESLCGVQSPTMPEFMPYILGALVLFAAGGFGLLFHALIALPRQDRAASSPTPEETRS